MPAWTIGKALWIGAFRSTIPDFRVKVSSTLNKEWPESPRVCSSEELISLSNLTHLSFKQLEVLGIVDGGASAAGNLLPGDFH